jgi:hypothetical protein
MNGSAYAECDMMPESQRETMDGPACGVGSNYPRTMYATGKKADSGIEETTRKNGGNNYVKIQQWRYM